MIELINPPIRSATFLSGLATSSSDITNITLISEKYILAGNTVTIIIQFTSEYNFTPAQNGVYAYNLPFANSNFANSQANVILSVNNTQLPGGVIISASNTSTQGVIEVCWPLGNAGIGPILQTIQATYFLS